MKKANQLKNNGSLVIGHWSLNRGFSLVELLVIVSIISILSITSVAGFGRLKEILQLKEATHFLSDLIKQEELKVLRGDYDRAVIHFFKDYVVIEEYPADLAFDLFLYDQCPHGYGVKLGNEDGTTLIQKSPHGVVQTRNLQKNKPDCTTDFKKSPFTELSYQLVKGQEVSNVIRFMHFNLNRNPQDETQKDSIPSPVEISWGAKSRIEMVAPYGNKTIFNHENTIRESSIIHLIDKTTQTTETLTLQ